MSVQDALVHNLLRLLLAERAKVHALNPRAIVHARVRARVHVGTHVGIRAGSHVIHVLLPVIRATKHVMVAPLVITHAGCAPLSDPRANLHIATSKHAYPAHAEASDELLIFFFFYSNILKTCLKFQNSYRDFFIRFTLCV